MRYLTCRRSPGAQVGPVRGRGHKDQGAGGGTGGKLRRARGSRLLRLLVPACTASVMLVGTAQASEGGALSGASAQGPMRLYKLVYEGHLTLSYTASDKGPAVNPFDLEGCAYKQAGDITVYWRSAWQIQANVYPRTGHVQVHGITRLSGPTDPSEPGDSEISGKNSNAGSSNYCAATHKTGLYDCTTEVVKPFHPNFQTSNPVFDPDPDHPKSFLVHLSGFDHVRADYSGQAPSGYQCPTEAGSDAYPGGQVGGELSMNFGDIDFVLAHDVLVDLGRGTPMVGVVGSSSDAHWVINNFPAPGASCASGSTEVCTYKEAERASRITITRSR
jgi:hypothetical protein